VKEEYGFSCKGSWFVSDQMHNMLFAATLLTLFALLNPDTRKKDETTEYTNYHIQGPNSDAAVLIL
jgi:hypothetical protein